jgi:hypothetical protein
MLTVSEHHGVQFLDSASVITDGEAEAHDLAGAIALIEAIPWPAGAERMRILDAQGRVIHQRVKADEQ